MSWRKTALLKFDSQFLTFNKANLKEEGIVTNPIIIGPRYLTKKKGRMAHRQLMITWKGRKEKNK